MTDQKDSLQGFALALEAGDYNALLGLHDFLMDNGLYPEIQAKIRAYLGIDREHNEPATITVHKVMSIQLTLWSLRHWAGVTLTRPGLATLERNYRKFNKGEQ